MCGICNVFHPVSFEKEYKLKTNKYTRFSLLIYRSGPKHSDMSTGRIRSDCFYSDQGLQCSPFCLHLSDYMHQCMGNLFKCIILILGQIQQFEFFQCPNFFFRTV